MFNLSTSKMWELCEIGCMPVNIAAAMVRYFKVPCYELANNCAMPSCSRCILLENACGRKAIMNVTTSSTMSTMEYATQDPLFGIIVMLNAACKDSVEHLYIVQWVKLTVPKLSGRYSCKIANVKLGFHTFMGKCSPRPPG